MYGIDTEITRKPIGSWARLIGNYMKFNIEMTKTIIVAGYCFQIKKRPSLRLFFLGLSPKNVNNLTP
jgi:hypothetical protein